MEDEVLIRTLIVDDEPLARATLRQLLVGDPEIELVGECSDGNEAVARIREDAPDLVFLDVQMPELDGFEVLSRLGDARPPLTVFVTAYDQHAIRAFDFYALDYLLKPFTDERFAAALEKAKSTLRREESADFGERVERLLAGLEYGAPSASEKDQASSARYLERIAIKAKGTLKFVRVEDITWIEAADYCVRIHTAEGTHTMRDSLKNLESRLPPELFCRIHRSAIVNLDRIKELQPYFHGDYIVVLHDGRQLRLSRSRREQLMRRLRSDL